MHALMVMLYSLPLAREVYFSFIITSEAPIDRSQLGIVMIRVNEYKLYYTSHITVRVSEGNSEPTFKNTQLTVTCTTALRKVSCRGFFHGIYRNLTTQAATGCCRLVLTFVSEVSQSQEDRVLSQAQRSSGRRAIVRR